MSATTAPAALPERLAAILAWLADCVADQGNRKRLPGALVVAIWTRVNRVAAQFRAVAATPIPPPRPARAQPAANPTTAPPEDSPPQAPRTPRRPPVMPYGSHWLVRLIPGATASLSQLEALLRDPEMAALLAADARLGRILRPLCWALGVQRSLAPPLRRRRKPPALAGDPADPDSGQPGAPGSILPSPALATRRKRRKRFNLRGRDLLTRLRMGPSPYWS
jgi:hypothetical protein